MLRDHTRRSVLLAAAMTGLAGCAGQQASDQPATASATPTATPTPTPTPTAEPTPEQAPRYETPTLTVEPTTGPIAAAFPAQITVFGSRVIAPAGVATATHRHVAGVLAGFLDADGDGQPDLPAVADALASVGATVLVVRSEAELERAIDTLEGGAAPGAFVEVFTDEVHPSGRPHSAGGRFDATVEEVFHLITQFGYAQAFPSVFAEAPGSAIADAMDTARGGRFETPPSSYPAGAWYTYDDPTCSYDCQVTEYTYWAATTLMGAQADRASSIDDEWRLATPAALREGDPAAVAILSDPRWRLPETVPDGRYPPAAA